MELGPLPWREREIAAILPHRAPFLFVDRISALDPDRLVVGSHTWSTEETRVGLDRTGHAVPASYLAECMAQIGAVLILSKLENRGRLIYFMGIDRIRFRSPVRAGETLEVEAVVRRLRSRIGTLDGRARVGGRLVADGAMTFALGDIAAASA